MRTSLRALNLFVLALAACDADTADVDLQAQAQVSAAARAGGGGTCTDARKCGGTTTRSADYGDAPDATSGRTHDAYPGVTGNFPTADAAQGPMHKNADLRYALGKKVSLEQAPPVAVDPDGTDGDSYDDGVQSPNELDHCAEQSLKVSITAFAGPRYPLKVYVNAWLDFDRSGRWGGAHACGDGALASEWAVQNHVVTLTGPGEQLLDLPGALMFNGRPGEDLWMRTSIASEPAAFDDGRGPAKGYTYGETEDDRVEAVGTTQPIEPLPILRVAQFAAVDGTTQSGPPDGIATQEGLAREVDVVHIGGMGATKPPILVAAVGSGSAGKLVSLKAQSAGEAPTFLKKSPSLAGRNHKLHVLTPSTSPKIDYGMVLSGRIADGTLWLNTWRVAADGTFQMLDGRGYGPTSDFDVTQFAIAHRATGGGSQERYEVVTPVIGNADDHRIVTWEIMGNGAIFGMQDSGDYGVKAAPETDLAAVFVPGTFAVQAHYEVVSRAGTGVLYQSSWRIDGQGMPAFLGGVTTNRDIQGLNPFQQDIDRVAIAPLGATGHVAVTLDDVDGFKVTSWDHASCPSGTCNWSSQQISDETFDASPNTPGVQIAAPSVPTNRVHMRDPQYDDDLFSKNSDVVQAVASVRKVMVTLVALDAVADGQVSLDDQVVVSAAAANVNNTNASVMGLATGEVISLRNLLYGNMIVSGGDATWAISEHVAGTLNNMVAKMDAKAVELGLANTVHCQLGTTFSGVSYSTARDQALLWEAAYQDPQFLEFAGQDSQAVCGTLNNQPICHGTPPPLNKSMNQYPSLDGHKTGGGGGLCSAPQFNGINSCRGSGCVAIQSTRLGRSLIATVFQPSNLAANNPFADAATVFDYGYRRIFTPDYRGTSNETPAKDIALESVSDLFAVSAVATGHPHVTVCGWEIDVAAGDAQKTYCTQVDFNELPLGPANVPATALDVVRASTLEAEGDYLVGRLGEADQWSVQLWRVGSK